MTDAAAAVDAALVDAIPVDTPNGPSIRVTAYDSNNPDLPLPSATVQFIAPDHSIQTVTTDANGFAQAWSPANTTVVVIQTGGGSVPRVRIFEQTMPGDAIIAGYRVKQAFQTLGDIDFTLPVVSDTTQVTLTVSCGFPQQLTQNTFVVHAVKCPNVADATAVATTSDQVGNPLSGASTVRHLDLTALVGGTVTLPAYDAAPVTITSNFQNVPANAIMTEWETAYFFAGDPKVDSYANASPASAQKQLAAVGDRTLSTYLFQVPGYNGVNYSRVEIGQTTTFAVDASQTIRPILMPHYDKPGNAAAWTESTVGRQATIVTAIVLVSNNAGGKVQIELHAPHGATNSLAIPTLPAALQIGLGDNVSVQIIGQIFEGASYDTLIQTIDSNPGFTPIFWDPSFVGAVWSTN